MALISVARRKDPAFPPGTLDMRGWTVRTQLDDERIGKVDDMIVDAEGRPHFLDVDLGMFDQHVLVPVGRVRPSAGDEVVWVQGIRKEQLEHVPEYALDPETLTSAYERRLIEVWDRLSGSPVTEPASVPPVETGRSEYARLSAMEEYRVASADADPRGWTVVAGDGKKIGEVKELIVDTASMSARYLDCDIDEKALDLEPVDRHVLIPVRRARLDGDHRKVIVDGVFSTDVHRYPVYGGLPLEPALERRIDEVFGPWDDRAGDRVRNVTVENGGEVLVRQADGDVLIRVTSDDVIIEKRPRV